MPAKGQKKGRLSQKQEAFCVAMLDAPTQVGAYRRAYDATGMSDTSARMASTQLAKNPKIIARLADLRACVVERTLYGLEQAMAEAGRALVLAERLEQPGAMAQAVALRAKMNGLLVEDRRNERRPLADMSDEELARAIVEADKAIERAKAEV